MVKSIILQSKSVMIIQRDKSENMYVESLKNKKIMNFEYEEFMMYLQLINLVFLYREWVEK